MRVDGVVFVVVVAARGDAAFVDDGRRGTTVASRWVMAYCVYIYITSASRRWCASTTTFVRIDCFAFDSIRFALAAGH